MRGAFDNFWNAAGTVQEGRCAGKIRPGCFYKQYKGGLCTVLYVAEDAETEEAIVVFKKYPSTDGKIHTRPLNLFMKEFTIEESTNPQPIYPRGDTPYVIAIDFDDCICTGGWPDIKKGKVIESTVDLMYEQMMLNPKTSFVLWTARDGRLLDDALWFVRKHNIPIEFCNEQHPELIPILDPLTASSRKIWAFEYWDDKAKRINSL